MSNMVMKMIKSDFMKIGFTCSCFDLFHAGHVMMLKEAKEQCDDGNTLDGDECTSICQNTTPNTGPVATLIGILLIAIF